MTRTVAIVGPLPPLTGGIAQHTSQIARGFEENGWQVRRISWDRLYPSLLYRRAQWSRPRDGRDDTIDWSMRWDRPRSWWRTGRGLRDVDLVVVPYVHPVHAPALRVLMVAASPTPVAVHVHNPRPHEPLPMADRLGRLVLGRAAGLVGHAESIAEEVAALGVSTPVAVVAHPPDLDVTPMPLPTGPVSLLHLGYLRDYKGADVLLDAMPAVLAEHPEVRLTIAGDVWDGDHDRWHDHVARLGVSEAVDLRLGYVGDADIVDLLRTHHLLVAPYRAATQSGVVAMALAAGRAVVATDVGGLPDVVHDGVTGTLCAPGDPEALAGAIGRAVAELPSLTEGAAATRFRWATVASALAEAAGL